VLPDPAVLAVVTDVLVVSGVIGVIPVVLVVV